MHAADVTVTMNAVSTTMSLESVETGDRIDLGTPANKVYNFQAPAGDYILSGYATDGTTLNGTIKITVPEGDAPQEFKILTNTVYVTNKNSDGKVWTLVDGDYKLDVKVTSREGVTQVITVGNSITAGRNTFLALNGNSYYAAFIPSEAHQNEGYATLYKSATLTNNVNVSGAIPKGENYTVTVPADAEFRMGIKFGHFVDFTPVEPVLVEEKGDSKELTYYLAQSQIYNYRTWIDGGVTQAGYFNMGKDAIQRPVLAFTKNDYTRYNPATVNHDVASNEGYETGNIFVNINERGHLCMNVGETFKAHSMRTWELTDNSTNNYFMEPDFHYTVLDLDGKPSRGVIEISGKQGSAWSDIKAVGPGTAIVLVTYDGIVVNYYNNAEKKEYLGGEFWGAIWPENTAAYVVTVGGDATAIKPNMLVNEKYNMDALKVSGNNVDAEHDVFYYLDTEEGASYTFTPEGVTDVTIAYPVIGERMATYSGFGTEGVTKNADGSYTLLLKHGRQIIKLSDASGNSVYQVLTAKECHREIINASRPGSQIFQPGDKVKIQYSGLHHPANKLAGIYNMSAYVTYNGVPNGTSLILGAGQYTFGSAASAQAVTVEIPEGHDVVAEPEIVMDEGVIQVNGYGDPIGNHRFIDHVAGRSPNFTAVAHKTYFGAIPDVRIKLTSRKIFDIEFEAVPSDAVFTVEYDGKILEPVSGNAYSGTYGTYNVTASKDGYRCYRNSFIIGDDADGVQHFKIEMTEAADGVWDGKTMQEPMTDSEGCYNISNGAELAWLADQVNSKGGEFKAKLISEIDLGDYDWTVIGNTATKCYKGTFDGAGHAIKGLYVNRPTAQYQGLFGYLKSGSISGVETYGAVTGKKYVGGIVGYVHASSTVNRCANHANVTAESTHVGGVAGYLAQATSVLKDCYNTGEITGTTNCGGVVGSNLATATIENVFNIGSVTAQKAGACVGGTTAKTNVKKAFAIENLEITAGHTLVTEAQMQSGEVAYKLGEAFGQKIGEDLHPVLGGAVVKYNETDNTYYNDVESSVDEVLSGDAEVIGYYNAQGMESSVPFRGLNIVKMSDGTYRKVIF